MWAGYEDIRDFDGQWIRIEIKKGDLIVLPPGMYHRFTLDTNQYIKVMNPSQVSSEEQTWSFIPNRCKAATKELAWNWTF